MSDPTKPLLSDEEKEKFRAYLREIDDQRRMAMVKWWDDWKASVKASASSHVITALLAAASTKWLIPLVMKWVP